MHRSPAREKSLRWMGFALSLLLCACLSLSPAPVGGSGQVGQPVPIVSVPWGIERIGAPGAWEVTQGSPEIVVAVIDSGIDFTVPALSGVRWVNAGEIRDNGRDDDGNGYIDDVYGWDFREDRPGHLRCTALNPHGTAVASVIAARARELVGVAPNIRLMDLRFLDSQGLFYERDWKKLASAIDYAVDNGARVINLSIHAKLKPPVAVEAALKRAWEKGAVVVTITGNEGKNEVSWLARSPYVVAVSATDHQDNLASFSNWGQEVDLAGPGVGIPVLMPSGAAASLSGTSFAAPHITGTLALLLSADPSLTAAEALSLLFRTAEPLGSGPGDPRFGNGLPNADRAVRAP